MTSSSKDEARESGDAGDGEHSEQLRDLSAYLLDALPPDERDVVREHLGSCSRCQNQLLVMAPLPGLLNRLRPDPEATLPPPPPPPVLRERLINQVLVARGRQRRRQRVAAGAGGLVTAAALVVGVAAVGVPGTGTARPTVQALAYRPVAWVQPADGRHAAAAVVDHSWGTQLDIQASGWPPGGVSNIAVLTWSGTVQRLGSWAAPGSAALHCSTSTWSRLKDLRAVQILDSSGRLVAQLPLTT